MYRVLYLLKIDDESHIACVHCIDPKNVFQVALFYYKLGKPFSCILDIFMYVPSMELYIKVLFEIMGIRVLQAKFVFIIQPSLYQYKATGYLCLIMFTMI